MKLPKEIRRKYDATSTDRRLSRVNLRLSMEERTVLEQRMKEEEWENAAGYVRSKIFPGGADIEYRRILKSGDRKKVTPALSFLIEELIRRIGYLNDRFEHELAEVRRITEPDSLQSARRLAGLVRAHQRSVLQHTGGIAADIRTIANSLKREEKI